MAYVDLNPIRACMADTPEESDYTSKTSACPSYCALEVTIGDLMEEPSPTRNKRGPQSKLQLQIEQVHTLPRAKQKFVSEILETVIQGH